jgi:hypothetical protein
MCVYGVEPHPGCSLYALKTFYNLGGPVLQPWAMRQVRMKQGAHSESELGTRLWRVQWPQTSFVPEVANWDCDDGEWMAIGSRTIDSRQIAQYDNHEVAKRREERDGAATEGKSWAQSFFWFGTVLISKSVVQEKRRDSGNFPLKNQHIINSTCWLDLRSWGIWKIF